MLNYKEIKDLLVSSEFENNFNVIIFILFLFFYS